ncbi:MAG: lamin tail domain-containing protein, partial [Planctomycetales bacterium]|nr:lamin tail domain-containing protein [Planctomycetales bacterium]
MKRSFVRLVSAQRSRLFGESVCATRIRRQVERLEPRQMLAGTPLITEFMAVNDGTIVDEDGAYSDWIELHNPDAVALDLAGWSLTDDANDLTQWTFPSVVLASGDYLVVRASGLDRMGTGPGGEYHTNFKLSGAGEYLALVAPDGLTVVQEFTANEGVYPEQASDVSYGLELGTLDEVYFFQPTPGAPNNGPTSDSPSYRVLINEIMYHPDSLSEAEEYIELFNDGNATVDLAGWQFTAGVEFEFPAGATLAPGGYLVVAADVAAFSAKYPQVDLGAVYGDWAGSLSNGSESIELSDASGARVDRVVYADEGDWAQRVRGPNDQGHFGWQWFAAHDAGGSSLELQQPGMTNDLGQNWASSAVAQG